MLLIVMLVRMLIMMVPLLLVRMLLLKSQLINVAHTDTVNGQTSNVNIVDVWQH